MADIRKRKRDLLRDYAEMINGQFVAVVRQGRTICDDWNALMQLPDVIRSIGNREYAQVKI